MRLVALALALPALLAAQGVRISGVTTMQLVELRPLRTDSLPAASVPGTGEQRVTAEGVPAVCPLTSDWCIFEGSASRVSAAPVIQDVTVAAWGWQQGLSFHAQLRARTQLGDRTGLLYPRSGDHFDAVEAYAELDRERWRARLGRIWVTGGLGAYAFDGGTALWRRAALSVEGWAGRALLAGLSEPYSSSELAAVDNLPPRQNGYVAGGRARYRPDPLTAAVLTYQRVIAGDRSGLYSERAALDVSSRGLPATADLGLAYDFAAGGWNEARLRVGTAWSRPVDVSLEARHSRPFFELWTIWGAFSPVAFNEARTIVDWTPRGSPLSVAVRAAYRRYEETDAGLSLRTNGWRAGAEARWLGERSLSANASYDVDIGSGAASTDVRAGVRWARSSTLSLGADLSATQSIYEFRVGTGRILGAGVSGSYAITPDVRVAGDAALYQHALTNGAPGPDWTQRRATARLEWTLGRDPGAYAGRAP